MLLMIGTSIVGVWEDLAAALTLCVWYHVNIIDDRALVGLAQPLLDR